MSTILFFHLLYYIFLSVSTSTGLSCNETYPKLEVAALFPVPYTGIYIIHAQPGSTSMKVIYVERPFGVEYEPKIVERLLDLPSNFPLNKGDRIFTKDETFHILKGEIIRSFKQLKDQFLESYSSEHAYLKENPDAVFELMDKKEKYIGIVHRITDDGKRDIEILSSRTMESVATTTMEFEADIEQYIKQFPINGIALFDQYNKDGPRLGVISFGAVLRNFILTFDDKTVSMTMGPLYAAQSLFGCPQTFCFSAAIDAIDYREEPYRSRIMIIRQEYIWYLNDFSDTFKMPEHLCSMKTQDDTNYELSAPIEATVNSDEYYIFKNKRVYFKMRRSDFKVHVWRRISHLFKSQDPTLWSDNVDAAMQLPHRRNNVVIFMNDRYYIFAKTGDFFTEKSSGFLGDIKDYPAHVDGAFYHTLQNTTYVFSGNWVYLHTISKEQQYPSEVDAEPKYFQQLFSACEGYNYEETAYKQWETFTGMNNELPSALVVKTSAGFTFTFMYVLGPALFGIVVLALLTWYYLSIRKAERIEAEWDLGDDPEPLARVRSGYSVTVSLNEARNQRIKTKRSASTSKLALREK